MIRQIRNARITGTTLGYEHGVLTAVIHLDYGVGGQGFGGVWLDAGPGGADGFRRPSLACGVFIARVLAIAGVERWEDIPGAYVRADADGGHVYRLGHALRDEWFEPAHDLPRPTDD